MTAILELTPATPTIAGAAAPDGIGNRRCVICGRLLNECGGVH